MAHRYFTSDITQNTASITGADAAHLAKVLRIKQGEIITLCDGVGNDYEAEITQVSVEIINLRVLSKTISMCEPTLAAHMYVAMPKADKLDFVVQKVVELGGVSIHPFYSEFTVAKPKNEENKTQRWQRIATEAAKQCGRGVLPQVFAPVSFAQMLEEVSALEKALIFHQVGGVALPMALGANGYSLQFTPAEGEGEGKPLTSAAFITGAEGGFSDTEIEKAQAAGCVVTGLGPRILRCETAPIAALSAAMLCTGNLG